MKKNSKGFSLVELLGVIVVVGIMTGLGITAITRIVEHSRREAFINAIKIQQKGIEKIISNDDYYVYDEDTAYYFEYKLTSEDDEGRSPYSDWVCAYVIVTYDGQDIKYYWTGIDETGWTLTNNGLKKEIDKLTISDMTISSLKKCPDDPSGPENLFDGKNQKVAYMSNGDIITGGSKNDVSSEKEEFKKCYNYELLGDGTYKIISYSASCSKEVKVPQTIDKIPVTVIGESAFADLGLTKVILYDGVTTIGKGAFKNNTIKELILPPSIKKIEKQAFIYNSTLEQVTFPEGLESIGYETFAYCGLTSVILPLSLTYLGDRAFYNNKIKSYKIENSALDIGIGSFTKNQLSNDDSIIYALRTDKKGNKYYEVVSYAGKGGAITIANTNPHTTDNYPVKSIASGAFYDSKITQVTIPKESQITTLGFEAFAYNQIKEIELPESLTTIDRSAFRDNYLSKITIPKNVSSIGAGAFAYNCFPEETAAIYARKKVEKNGKKEVKIDYTTIVSIGTGKSNAECKKKGVSTGTNKLDLTKYLKVTAPDEKTYTLSYIPIYAFEGNYYKSIKLPTKEDMENAGSNLTIDANAFWLNKVSGNDKFIYKITNGKIDYSTLDSYAGHSEGMDENGFLEIPATAYDPEKEQNVELQTINATFSWSSKNLKTIKIPSSVTVINPKQMLLKHARSNPNLEKIIYNGETSFNWYKLTGSDMAPADITQSQIFNTDQVIRHPYGDIVVSSS